MSDSRRPAPEPATGRAEAPSPRLRQTRDRSRKRSAGERETSEAGPESGLEAGDGHRADPSQDRSGDQAPENAGPAPKKSARVAQILRTRIVRGEIKAGEYLPLETELIAQLGVSRPTLRAALRILESESLLTITTGSRKGPRVHLPSAEVAARHVGLVLQSRQTTLADVYLARQLCEPIAVRLLVARRTPALLSELAAAINAEYRALQDSEAFGRAEVQFHETLFELAGNQTLTLLIQMLHTLFERHALLVNRIYERRSDAEKHRMLAIRSHEKLLDLIKSGDAAGAELFWSKHLQSASRIMLQSRSMSDLIDLLE